MATNVVTRHEPRLNEDTDGNERRHRPPVAHHSHEPRATSRSVRCFDGRHTQTDDLEPNAGDIAWLTPGSDAAFGVIHDRQPGSVDRHATHIVSTFTAGASR